MEQKRRAGIIKAYMNRMNFGQGCLAHMVANLHTDQQFRKEIAYWLDWHPNRQWCWPAGEKIWKWFLDTENRRNLGMAMMPNRCAKMVGSLFFFFLIQLRRDCSENTHFNRTTNTHTQVRVRLNGTVSKRVHPSPLCYKCAKHLTRPIGHGTHRYTTKEIKGWGAFYENGETRKLAKQKKKVEEKRQEKSKTQEKRKKNKKRTRITLSSTGASRCQVCFLIPEEDEEVIYCSTCTKSYLSNTTNTSYSWKDQHSNTRTQVH